MIKVIIFYSYSSGGEDGYVRVQDFDPAYFDFNLDYWTAEKDHTFYFLNNNNNWKLSPNNEVATWQTVTILL